MEAENKRKWEEIHRRGGGWVTRPIATIAHSHFRKQIREGDTVLELAFGISENLKALRKRAKGGRIIGIDFSREAVSKAAEDLKGEPGIEVSLGDVHNLALKDNIADKAILNDFFGMYPKDKCIPLLKEIHRVLKPGGLFMFTAYTQKIEGTEGVSSSHPFTQSELREFIREHLGPSPKVEIKTIPENEHEWKEEIHKRIKSLAQETLKRKGYWDFNLKSVKEAIKKAEKGVKLEDMWLICVRKATE